MPSWGRRTSATAHVHAGVWAQTDRMQRDYADPHKQQEADGLTNFGVRCFGTGGGTAPGMRAPPPGGLVGALSEGLSRRLGPQKSGETWPRSDGGARAALEPQLHRRSLCATVSARSEFVVGGVMMRKRATQVGQLSSLALSDAWWTHDSPR